MTPLCEHARHLRTCRDHYTKRQADHPHDYHDAFRLAYGAAYIHAATLLWAPPDPGQRYYPSFSDPPR